MGSRFSAIFFLFFSYSYYSMLLFCVLCQPFIWSSGLRVCEETVGTPVSSVGEALTYKYPNYCFSFHFSVNMGGLHAVNQRQSAWWKLSEKVCFHLVLLTPVLFSYRLLTEITSTSSERSGPSLLCRDSSVPSSSSLHGKLQKWLRRSPLINWLSMVAGSMSSGEGKTL